MNNKVITKNIRKTQTINYILSKKYVIFINFLNKDTLNLFKKFINTKYLVNIIFITNILKKSNHNNNFLITDKTSTILTGGVHAIICKNLTTVEYILNLFSQTEFYKDKYSSFFKVLKLNQEMPLRLGFITQIKIYSYFFNFNSQFINFFFFLQNETNKYLTTLFSRQIVVATVWLFKSLMMISLYFFIILINFFFFLIKQLFFFPYAYKKSITS